LKASDTTTSASTTISARVSHAQRTVSGRPVGNSSSSRTNGPYTAGMKSQVPSHAASSSSGSGPALLASPTSAQLLAAKASARAAPIARKIHPIELPGSRAATTAPVVAAASWTATKAIR